LIPADKSRRLDQFGHFTLFIFLAMAPFLAPAGTETVFLDEIDYGTTAYGGYRWRDVAGNLFSDDYRTSYSYGSENVTVRIIFETVATSFSGNLLASNLKPNFTYQLKLSGFAGETGANEKIGLAGRWWQETWDGAAWGSGANLNNKGDGSSPNPNDAVYFSRRDIADPTSPTGKKYRYTGYLVFDYFITDEQGNASLDFLTGSCFHVLWNTIQRTRSGNDGPPVSSTFDPDPLKIAYDVDYSSSTMTVFGEWERLPMGDVPLDKGDYNCQLYLTEESFHGWPGGDYCGGWAAAMGADITFAVVEGFPSVSFRESSSQADEGTSAGIEVILSEPFGYTASVDWFTSGVTASPGNDFEATTGTLVFEAGTTTKTLAVELQPDRFDERPGESLKIILSGPEYMEIGDPRIHDLFIRDDDHAPSFTAAEILPDPPLENAPLTVSCSGWEDPDGDPEGYLYQWKKNGQSLSGATSDTLSSESFLAGELVSCEVTAFDGYNKGARIEAPSVLIQSAPPSRVHRWKRY